MATCRRFYIAGSRIINNLNFSTTCSPGNKWRREQGLEPEPRQYGPLTNLPDYSFVDGRPMILSKRKVEKIQYQKNLCKRIVELTNEVDVGLQQYYDRQEQLKREKETILKNKLKPKGIHLLSKMKKASDPEV